jgi:hypothetical protein
MLTNDRMTAGRYLRWHKARQALRKIEDHCAAGGRVQVATYTRSTVYRSADWFRAGRDGLYVRRGKAWDFIGGCTVRLVA